MKQAEYDAYVDELKSGRVVEHGGRTAATVEELDWIRDVEAAGEKEGDKAVSARTDANTTLTEAQDARQAKMDQGHPKATEGAAVPIVDVAAGEAAAASPVQNLEDLAQIPPVNPGQAEAKDAVKSGDAPKTVEGDAPDAVKPKK